MSKQDHQIVSQLNNQKIVNILKLEELLHNHFLSVQLLHELISLYTCAIEYLDQSQSALRFYFLEKIQFALSRPEIQKMLEKVNNSGDQGLANSLRETLRLTGSAQIAKHFDQNERKVDAKLLSKYDGEKQQEKRKKINMQLQLMNQVQNNMKTLKDQLEDAKSSKKNQRNRINNAAEEQELKLKERIQRRKKLKKRKNSFDDKNNAQIIMNKTQLLQVQKDITDAVMRITIRLTQRQFNMKKQSSKSNQKNLEYEKSCLQGRIKKANRCSQEDYD